MSDLGRLLPSFSGDACLEEGVICPKPRRLGVVTFSTPEVVKPVRQKRSMPPAGIEGEAGNEILEIFLNKTSSGDAASFGGSPPYFSGSPPSRVGNPLIRDEEFSHQRRPPSPSLVTKSKSSKAPISFRASPPVRVEGFDCSGRGFDCRARDARCQVSAFA